MVHPASSSSCTSDEDIHRIFERAAIEDKCAVAAGIFANDQRILPDQQLAAVEFDTCMVALVQANIHPADSETPSH
jgi:hypothetical protein